MVSRRSLDNDIFHQPSDTASNHTLDSATSDVASCDKYPIHPPQTPRHKIYHIACKALVLSPRQHAPFVSALDQLQNFCVQAAHAPLRAVIVVEQIFVQRCSDQVQRR